MLGIDPGVHRHLPRSERRKRRAYWLLWKKAHNPNAEEETGVDGVTRSSSQSPELEGATIIEG